MSNFEHIYSANHASDPDAFSGQGVNISDPRIQMSQGALQATGGALDLAVTGQGFFTVVQGNQIETPFFTRDGSFNITADGQVVTNDGLKVMGYKGDQTIGGLINLVIPTTKTNLDDTVSIITNVNVNSKVKITATYGLDDEVIVGSFGLAAFTNEPGLNPVGNNRYQQNTKSGLAAYGVAMDNQFGKIDLLQNRRLTFSIDLEFVVVTE